MSRISRREFAALVASASLSRPAFARERTGTDHPRDPELGRTAAGGRSRHRPGVRQRRRRDPPRRGRGRAHLGRPRRPADRHRVELRRCRGGARRGRRRRRRARQGLHRDQARVARRRRTQALAGAAEDRKGRPAAAAQRAAIRASRSQLSTAGRPKGCAATSASRRPTTPTSRALEAVLGREQPDFVQIDYSLDDRSAEARILPLAAEVKAGVLTALPFGRGAPLPCGARQGAARLGAALRRQLGAVLPQVPARRPARHRGHPRHLRRSPHGRQPRRDARPAARHGRAPAHGRVHRQPVAAEDGAHVAATIRPRFPMRA